MCSSITILLLDTVHDPAGQVRKVFESHKTCSNAAHQLVDCFFLLCVLPMATNSGTINSKNKDYIIKDNSTLILSDQVDSLIS